MEKNLEKALEQIDTNNAPWVSRLIQQKLSEAQEEANERSKEITGLYAVINLGEGSKPLEERFLEFVENHVSPSMHRPEAVYVELVVDGKKFVNRHDGALQENKITSTIIVNQKERGHLSVGYVEDIPFLLEQEQKLINSFGIGVSRIIGKSDRESKYKFLIDNSPIPIFVTT
jgi:hypothetical protein